MVRSHELWYLLLLLFRDVAVGEGGGFVMWVCAGFGCKVRVSVYRCCCPVWVSGLLSVLHRCISLMSVSYGFCGKEKNNKVLWVGNSCDESRLSGNQKSVLTRVLPILCYCGDPCVKFERQDNKPETHAGQQQR